MFWPRFKLSPNEERNGAVKYFDHAMGKRGVLRKMYPGFLSLTQQQRAPQFSFAIARRSRVFGFTASGDLGQFLIQFQDSTGEQYFSQPVPMATLLGGYVDMPPPAYAAAAGPTGGYPINVDDAANTLGWGYPIGTPATANPLIFEPSIVLDANEALAIQAIPATDYGGYNYRVDFVLHVWEFPSWLNGPA